MLNRHQTLTTSIPASNDALRRKRRAAFSNRRYWSIVGIFAYIAMWAIGPGSLMASLGNDANRIADLAWSTGGEGSTGYAVMAFVYAKLPNWQIIIISFLAGFLYSVAMFRNISNLKSGLAILFIYIGPLMTFLCFFQKDTFAIPVILCAYYAISTSRNCKNYDILLIGISYIAYGVLIRQYWILIYITFLIFYYYKSLPLLVKFSISSIFLTFLLVIPNNYFEFLQGSRDKFNLIRLHTNPMQGNTAFFNLVPPDSLHNFIINYLYSIIRLNLPILFNVRIQEIFLQMNVIIWLVVSIWAIRQKEKDLRLFGSLFFAHLAILPLFEPDLGSYLRHVSTAILLLTVPVGRLLHPTMHFSLWRTATAR